MSDDVQYPEIESAHFRRVLGHLPTGVTVVTGMTPDGPMGLAVGSFVSISLEPPLVGFFPTNSSSSWPGIKASGSFCVNILAADQEDVCRIFASKGEDKFASVEWSPSPETGSPLLAGAQSWVDCRIHSVTEAGDHDLCMGRVVQLEVAREDTLPLIFFKGGYGYPAVD